MPLCWCWCWYYHRSSSGITTTNNDDLHMQTYGIPQFLSDLKHVLPTIQHWVFYSKNFKIHFTCQLWSVLPCPAISLVHLSRISLWFCSFQTKNVRVREYSRKCMTELISRSASNSLLKLLNQMQVPQWTMNSVEIYFHFIFIFLFLSFYSIKWFGVKSFGPENDMFR